MNIVVLIGNLATDVETRELDAEKRLGTFRLAVDRSTPEDEADFFRIVTWGKQAELCGRYLTKGRRVAVEGRLRSSSWESVEGERRSAVEVVATRVEFLSVPSEPVESVAAAADA